MNNDPVLAIFLITAILVIVVFVIVASIFGNNPFLYPYFIYPFDVSGKRNIDIEECIEEYLLNSINRETLIKHKQLIDKWKKDNKEKAESYGRILRKTRIQQYEDAIDDDHAFQFRTIRSQTRYKQRQYQKSSYQVYQTDEEISVNWEWLVEKNNQLAAINYETTLKKYHSKNQRNRMNPELRKQILKRDNYTCQICGRYEPDGFGLQVDHIIPVSKGGKTVPSNLQVLCYQCNLKKSTKLIPPKNIRKTYASEEISGKQSQVVFPNDPKELFEGNTEEIPVIFPDDADDF